MKVTIETFIEKLEGAVQAPWAEYAQAYVESKDSLEIVLKDGEVDAITPRRIRGWNLKAFKNGSWGFSATDELSEEAIGVTLREVREILELAPKRDRTVFKLNPLRASFLFQEPQPYKLKDKIDLLKRYDAVISEVSQREGIPLKRRIYWQEVLLDRAVVTSEGRALIERRLHLDLLLEISGEEGGRVEQLYLRRGFTNDWYSIFTLDESVRELAERVVNNLRAEPLPTGRYDVILDPYLGGVFIHEAFGHLAEADHHEDDPKMRELFYLGRDLGVRGLNVRETGTLWGLRGYQPFDDEGVIVEDVYLLRDGVISGFLHSRSTAAQFGAKPTGNARLEGYYKDTLVRMRTTLIEPGNHSLEEMVSSLDKGLLLRASRGGMTKFDEFTFTTQEALLIRGGKIVGRYRDAMLRGNVFDTLKKVEMIGNELEVFSGTCGKWGSSVPVSAGSPYLLLRDVLVIGS